MSDVTPSPHDDWRSRRHAGETGSWIAGVILITHGLRPFRADCRFPR